MIIHIKDLIDLLKKHGEPYAQTGTTDVAPGEALAITFPQEHGAVATQGVEYEDLNGTQIIVSLDKDEKILSIEII